MHDSADSDDGKQTDEPTTHIASDYVLSPANCSARLAMTPATTLVRSKRKRKRAKVLHTHATTVGNDAPAEDELDVELANQLGELRE